MVDAEFDSQIAVATNLKKDTNVVELVKQINSKERFNITIVLTALNFSSDYVGVHIKLINDLKDAKEKNAKKEVTEMLQLMIDICEKPLQKMQVDRKTVYTKGRLLGEFTGELILRFSKENNYFLTAQRGKLNYAGRKTFYEGSFGDDLTRDGFGRLTTESNKDIYCEGEWENDYPKPNAIFTLSYSSVELFAGYIKFLPTPEANLSTRGSKNIVMGGSTKDITSDISFASIKDFKRANGKGLLKTDTEIFVGSFSNNVKNGYGITDSCSGERIIGNFKNEKRDGPTAIISLDGSIASLNFNQGEVEKSARYSLSNGVTISGEWKKGKLKTVSILNPTHPHFDGLSQEVLRMTESEVKKKIALLGNQSVRGFSVRAKSSTQSLSVNSERGASMWKSLFNEKEIEVDVQDAFETASPTQSSCLSECIIKNLLNSDSSSLLSSLDLFFRFFKACYSRNISKDSPLLVSPRCNYLYAKDDIISLVEYIVKVIIDAYKKIPEKERQLKESSSSDNLTNNNSPNNNNTQNNNENNDSGLMGLLGVHSKMEIFNFDMPHNETPQASPPTPVSGNSKKKNFTPSFVKEKILAFIQKSVFEPLFRMYVDHYRLQEYNLKLKIAAFFYGNKFSLEQRLCLAREKLDLLIKISENFEQTQSQIQIYEPLKKEISSLRSLRDSIELDTSNENKHVSFEKEKNSLIDIGESFVSCVDLYTKSVPQTSSNQNLISTLRLCADTLKSLNNTLLKETESSIQENLIGQIRERGWECIIKMKFALKRSLMLSVCRLLDPLTSNSNSNLNTSENPSTAPIILSVSSSARSVLSLLDFSQLIFEHQNESFVSTILKFSIKNEKDDEKIIGEGIERAKSVLEVLKECSEVIDEDFRFFSSQSSIVKVSSLRGSLTRKIKVAKSIIRVFASDLYAKDVCAKWEAVLVGSLDDILKKIDDALKVFKFPNEPTTKEEISNRKILDIGARMWKDVRKVVENKMETSIRIVVSMLENHCKNIFDLCDYTITSLFQISPSSSCVFDSLLISCLKSQFKLLCDDCGVLKASSSPNNSNSFSSSEMEREIFENNVSFLTERKAILDRLLRNVILKMKVSSKCDRNLVHSSLNDSGKIVSLSFSLVRKHDITSNFKKMSSFASSTKRPSLSQHSNVINYAAIRNSLIKLLGEEEEGKSSSKKKKRNTMTRNQVQRNNINIINFNNSQNYGDDENSTSNTSSTEGEIIIKDILRVLSLHQRTARVIEMGLQVRKIDILINDHCSKNANNINISGIQNKMRESVTFLEKEVLMTKVSILENSLESKKQLTFFADLENYMGTLLKMGIKWESIKKKNFLIKKNENNNGIIVEYPFNNSVMLFGEMKRCVTGKEKMEMLEKMEEKIIIEMEEFYGKKYFEEDEILPVVQFVLAKNCSVDCYHYANYAFISDWLVQTQSNPNNKLTARYHIFLKFFEEMRDFGNIDFISNSPSSDHEHISMLEVISNIISPLRERIMSFIATSSDSNKSKLSSSDDSSSGVLISGSIWWIIKLLNYIFVHCNSVRIVNFNNNEENDENFDDDSNNKDEEISNILSINDPDLNSELLAAEEHWNVLFGKHNEIGFVITHDLEIEGKLLLKFSKVFHPNVYNAINQQIINSFNQNL